MVDWKKWKSTKHYFGELPDLYKYCKENNIKQFDYTFTFAYGYQLLLPRK